MAAICKTIASKNYVSQKRFDSCVLNKFLFNKNLKKSSIEVFLIFLCKFLYKVKNNTCCTYSEASLSMGTNLRRQKVRKDESHFRSKKLAEKV